MRVCFSLALLTGIVISAFCSSIQPEVMLSVATSPSCKSSSLPSSIGSSSRPGVTVTRVFLPFTTCAIDVKNSSLKYKGFSLKNWNIGTPYASAIILSTSSVPIMVTSDELIFRQVCIDYTIPTSCTIQQITQKLYEIVKCARENDLVLLLLVPVPFISLLVHFYPAWAEVNWFFVKLLKFPNQKHDSRSQKKSTFQYVINE